MNEDSPNVHEITLTIALCSYLMKIYALRLDNDFWAGPLKVLLLGSSSPSLALAILPRSFEGQTVVEVNWRTLGFSTNPLKIEHSHAGYDCKAHAEEITKRAPGKKGQVDEYACEVGKAFSRQRSIHGLSIHLSDVAQQLNGFSWEYKVPA